MRTLKRQTPKQNQILRGIGELGIDLGKLLTALSLNPTCLFHFFSLKKHNIMLLMSLKLEGVTVVVVCVLVF